MKLLLIPKYVSSQGFTDTPDDRLKNPEMLEDSTGSWAMSNEVR